MASELKLKGRKLYRGDELVAEIRGCRQSSSTDIHADFWVVSRGEKVAGGFCYFRDAVKWIRQNQEA